MSCRQVAIINHFLTDDKFMPTCCYQFVIIRIKIHARAQWDKHNAVSCIVPGLSKLVALTIISNMTNSQIVGYLGILIN